MFKMDCQNKYYLQYIDIINVRPIKTRKKIGTSYCLGCKDYTNNFKPQEIKMANKVLREKSNCVLCRSSKSRFLKYKHNNNK